jgi:outer membrane protein OmpA-like peptidoglycan-associated protein
LLREGFLERDYTFLPGTDAGDRIVYLTEEDLEERTGGVPVAGDVLVLEHIYYDFNKSAIRTGDARELESLAKMMLKYPSMTIELQSHTDARGTADYNLELSAKRGESVRDFLAARGIATSRVQLNPMGETQLRNSCTDNVPCTDEEHQANRRTEIRILSVQEDLKVKYPDR